MGGHRDDRRVHQFGIGAQRLDHLRPRHLWQTDVQGNQVGSVLPGEFKRILAVRGHHMAAAKKTQQFSEQLAADLVVFADEYRLIFQSPSLPASSLCAGYNV